MFSSTAFLNLSNFFVKLNSVLIDAGAGSVLLCRL